MSLTLRLDAARWRAHLDRTASDMPGLVPVVKGNGYGFGVPLLAAEAGRLGVDTVAVGEPEEVTAVTAAAYAGDVLVMAPWRPEWAGRYDAPPDVSHRVVRTVSHLDALRALQGSGARAVVECLTSMNRHGLTEGELVGSGPLLAGVRCEGFALHLPLDRAGTDLDDVTEVAGWVDRLVAADLPVGTVWVSHVTRAELATLRRRCPGVRLRPRVGTALWLGDPAAYRARATVLDVRPLRRGDRFGYRQGRATRPGTLLVVSGGTSHGIGLEAPRAVRGPVARSRLLAAAGLSAGGRNLSPFTIAGRKRWYAEPPHMQVSMVLLPAGVAPPRIGDEVPVDVRNTTTAFDRIEFDRIEFDRTETV